MPAGVPASPQGMAHSWLAMAHVQQYTLPNHYRSAPSSQPGQKGSSAA
jgi:hypothetical protein